MHEVKSASYGALRACLDSRILVVRNPRVRCRHSTVRVVESIVEDDDVGLSSSFELFAKQEHFLRAYVTFASEIGYSDTSARDALQAAGQIRGKCGPVWHASSVNGGPTKNPDASLWLLRALAALGVEGPAPDASSVFIVIEVLAVPGCHA